MTVINNYYENKGEIYGVSPQRRRKIFSLLGNIKFKKILDIGCGQGLLGAEIKKMGNTVVGVDISKQYAENAKKILDDAVAVNVQEEKIPYTDKYFDVIIMTEVIEHFLFPEIVLVECRRLLKDDGFIILTTPNFLLIENRLKILFGKFEYEEEGFYDRGHVHYYTFNSFEKDLLKAGLKVDKYNNVYRGFGHICLSFISKNLAAFQIAAKISKIT